MWNDARHKVKRDRDRVRAKGTNTNNKICFEVRAPSSTSPPSHRRIWTPLACPQRTPTKGTSTEDLGQPQLQGVPNSSPYKHNLLLEAQLQANNNHLTTWGITTNQYKDHLTTWGIQPKCTTSSTQWGQGTKQIMGLQLGGQNNNHKQSLSLTQRSYRTRK